MQILFLERIRKYLAFYKLYIKHAFSYRFSFAIWGILHPLRLVVLYFLWTAIFDYSGAAMIGGLTLTEMIFYFITNSVLDTYVGVDHRLPPSINDGSIVISFIKPIKIFWTLLFHELASRTNAFVFHMLPTAVFSFLFLGYRIFSVQFALLAVISAFLALIISYEYAFIFSTFTFWTKSFYGTRALKEGLLYILSGWLIPITLYPPLVQKILMYTPFPYISFVPPMIFIGKYTTVTALSLILLQVFWIAALYGVHRIQWHFAKKRFTGVGV